MVCHSTEMAAFVPAMKSVENMFSENRAVRLHRPHLLESCVSSRPRARPNPCIPRQKFRFPIAIAGQSSKSDPLRFLRGLALALVLISAVSFSSFEEFHSPIRAASAAESEETSLVKEVLEQISAGYVFPTDTENLEQQAARAVVSSLGDPFSSLSSEAKLDPLLKAVVASKDKEALGLGMAVVKDSRLPTQLTVTSVFEGGPSERSGIHTGDRIVAINGKAITSQTSLRDVAKVSSTDDPNGCKITIRGDGEKSEHTVQVFPSTGTARPRSLTLAFEVPLRAKTQGQTAAYIKLSDMGPTAGVELQEALSQIFPDPAFPFPSDASSSSPSSASTSTPPTALILDLRDNPGGLLSSGVEVASVLLAPNLPIVTQCTRSPLASPSPDSPSSSSICPEGYLERVFRTSEGQRLVPAGTKLVVLVNSATRSSAELVAAAVQDTDSGLVVGEPSYGKGWGQRVVRIGGGKGEGTQVLRLTTTRFLSPSGRSIAKPLAALASPASAAPSTSERAALDGMQAREEEEYVRERHSRAASPPKQYATANGRSVRGGRGVEPDVAVEEERRGAGRVGDILVVKGVYFDFASRWSERHPDAVDKMLQSAPSPMGGVHPLLSREEIVKMVLTDREALWNDFLAYADSDVLSASRIGGRDTAIVPADSRISRLAAALRSEGLAAAADAVEKSQVAEIEDLRRQLRSNRAAVEPRVHEAIFTRFLSTTDRVLTRLGEDKTLSVAKEVLSTGKYALLLQEGEAALQVAAPTQPRPATAKQAVASPKKVVAGFDADEECLAGQVCDKSEFVYVRIL